MFRLRPKYNCVYDSLLFTALRVISPWHQVVGAKAEHRLLTLLGLPLQMFPHTSGTLIFVRERRHF